jgi:hypothetical protein
MEDAPKGGKKKQLPVLTGPRVPQHVIEKAAALTKQVRPLGHPRAYQEDVIGALIDAAAPESAAAALTAYNPKLGQALAELDAADD